MVHFGRITPVHAASEGITSRTIRELIFRALDRLGPVAEILPDEVVRDEGLLDEDRALRWIHFFEDDGTLERARERLKFDELFTLELGVAYRKWCLERHATGVRAGVGARNVRGLGPATGTQSGAAGTRGQESLFGAPAGPPGHAPVVPVGGDDALAFALLSAAVTGRDRQQVLAGVRDGTVDLVIGTHALVQEGVEFADLSLAVID